MNSQAPVAGGLYAARGADGKFRVTKVLVIDEHAVHIRIYAERFDQLPEGLTSAGLSLGSLSGPDGFGIGHAPISRQGFLAEERTLLTVEPVAEEELEGYRIWAEDGDA